MKWIRWIKERIGKSKPNTQVALLSSNLRQDRLQEIILNLPRELLVSNFQLQAFIKLTEKEVSLTYKPDISGKAWTAAKEWLKYEIPDTELIGTKLVVEVLSSISTQESLLLGIRGIGDGTRLHVAGPYFWGMVLSAIMVGVPMEQSLHLRN